MAANEPIFIAAENVWIQIFAATVAREETPEDTVLERSRNSEPCRVPSVGSPINQGDKKENQWPRIPSPNKLRPSSRP